MIERRSDKDLHKLLSIAEEAKQFSTEALSDPKAAGDETGLGFGFVHDLSEMSGYIRALRYALGEDVPEVNEMLEKGGTGLIRDRAERQSQIVRFVRNSSSGDVPTKGETS